MGQKNNILLDMAANLSSLEEIFIKDKTKINKEAIIVAMLYIFEQPAYQSIKFGVTRDRAVDFYKKFDEVDSVQIKTFLKAIELECITKMGEYAHPLRKELNTAITTIREVEKAYNISLT